MSQQQQQQQRVFVSHSSADRAVATLEGGGVRCWVAPRDIDAGAEWGEAILDAIEACAVMVPVVSRHSNGSHQLKREVERVASRGVAIVPYRIEHVPPSRSLEFFVSNHHWLDAHAGPAERHLAELLRAVRLQLAETADSVATDAAAGRASVGAGRPTSGTAEPVAGPAAERAGPRRRRGTLAVVGLAAGGLLALLAAWRFLEPGGAALRQHDGRPPAGQETVAGGSPATTRATPTTMLAGPTEPWVVRAIGPARAADVIPARAGQPMTPAALVSRPAALPGATSWTIETRGDRGPVTDVACAGGVAATAGVDGCVGLWDLDSGGLVAILVATTAGRRRWPWSPWPATSS